MLESWGVEVGVRVVVVVGWEDTARSPYSRAGAYWITAASEARLAGCLCKESQVEVANKEHLKTPDFCFSCLGIENLSYIEFSF